MKNVSKTIATIPKYHYNLSKCVVSKHDLSICKVYFSITIRRMDNLSKTMDM
jgi:hypothetical protein